MLRLPSLDRDACLLTRRDLSALPFWAFLPGVAGAADVGKAPSEPFSFDTLTALASQLASTKYVTPVIPSPEILAQIDYGHMGQVRHSLDKALFPLSEFPVTFFHLSNLSQRPVRLFVIDKGNPQEVLYRKALFESPADSPIRQMPEGAGFAGFRVHDGLLPEAERQGGDWVAFLGASYFRSCGDDNQYGISARGIAINTAHPAGEPEEFPDFSRFYFTPAIDGEIEILALLEGPSVVGAYRFKLRKRPSIVIDVRCKLFFRQDVVRLGIAPATSMYYHSESYRSVGDDFRPEVHDSDGLAILTGSGEHIWRPLNNPPHAVLSSFLDQSPRRFGLLQRDRDFNNYHDEVRFEHRPHLWIEPLNDWGSGSVGLFEFPTFDEYHDNIVAFWTPERPVKAGDVREFAYRLRWPAKEPTSQELARCTATRLAKGLITPVGNRISGRALLERQFVVEFDGPALVGRDPAQATPVLTMSRGIYEDLHAWPEADGSARPWRVFFKVFAEGDEPVEMRLFLKQATETLSETWCFQYFPSAWT